MAKIAVMDRILKPGIFFPECNLACFFFCSVMLNCLCQYRGHIFGVFDEFNSGYELLFMIVDKRWSWCNEIEVWNGC